MADALVGTQTTRELFLEANGLPVSGAVLTYSVVSPSGNAFSASPVELAPGDGWYTVTLPASVVSAVGLWRETWARAATGEAWTFPFLALALGPALVSRRRLRHAISRLLRDGQRGPVTAATSTTLTDSNLRGGTDEWTGAELYLYAGTGRGQTRLVTGSAAGGVLTVPTWTTTPDTTTKYELHKRLLVRDVNDAINDALLDAIHQGVRIPAITYLALTTGTTTYAVPDGFVVVGDLAWQDTTASVPVWYPLRDYAPDSYHPADYRLARGTRLLEIPRGATTGVQVRLTGMLEPSLLERDDAVCDIEPGYVQYRAAAMLALSGVQSPALDRDAAAQMGAVWLDQAQRLMPSSQPIPNAKPVY